MQSILARPTIQPILSAKGQQTGVKCPQCGKSIERALSFLGYICINCGRVFFGEIKK